MCLKTIDFCNMFWGFWLDLKGQLGALLGFVQNTPAVIATWLFFCCHFIFSHFWWMFDDF